MNEMTLENLEMLFNISCFKDCLADAFWTYFEHNGGETLKTTPILGALNDCTM